MLTNHAHSTDVNVISWNQSQPLLLSGADDGSLKIWDLRQFSKCVCVCLCVIPLNSLMLVLGERLLPCLSTILQQ